MKRDRTELFKAVEIGYSKVKDRLEEIINLLARQELSCSELAKMLGVSERMVKRDIRYLRSVGYKIIVKGYHDKKYKLLG